MYRIFDAHCHIYPDRIAQKAVEGIDRFYGHLPFHPYDGTTGTLRRIGQEAGISHFLVHSVAVDKYDLVIISKKGQVTTYFDKYTPEKIDYYFGPTQSGEIAYFPLDANSEQLCNYNSLESTISREIGNENSVPIGKICILSDKFYENHPFRTIYQTKNYFILLNLIKHPIR